MLLYVDENEIESIVVKIIRIKSVTKEFERNEERSVKQQERQKGQEANLVNLQFMHCCVLKD